MKIKLFVSLMVGILLFGCSQNATPTAVPVVATQTPFATPSPRLRVYIDDNLMVQTDDSRIISGGFNLGIMPGTHALFDDIRVTALDENP